jgi:hypothetical protein
MDHSYGGGHIRILEIQIELTHLIFGQHPFINNGA